MKTSPYRFSLSKTDKITEMVDEIVEKARFSNASDIHIDPKQSDVQVRFRIDGILHVVCTYPRSIHAELVARIKIMAGLRIDEKIMPQDGRMTVGEELDVRVTVIASYYGESVVMRLLRRTASVQTLSELGFSEEDQEKIIKILKNREGLILVTGPTGSGKTTTLYSLLSLVNDSTTSTITIEDPVEYAMPNARQIQVQQKRGINFVNGLRSILRQDPDVIMVGEMRDYETAAMATNAALTGHLVLSTLHTNDAISTVTRCVEMGIEPYLVAATLRLVISQRLLRKLCLTCRTLADMSLSERLMAEKYADTSELMRSKSVYIAKGCEKCNGTGYCGRTVVSEILSINDLIAEKISTRKPFGTLKKLGIRSIKNEAVTKYIQGITSFEETIKILHE